MLDPRILHSANLLTLQVHFWTHGGIISKVDPAHPLVMGHEASGTVHEIGEAVTSLKIGDKIAIEPGYPCRRCKVCKAGRYNFCPGMTFAADPPNSHGALTKFFKMPEDFCYKLPEFMGLDEAHITRLADIRVGQDVVIFGAGTIGLLCAAVAVSMGARKIISVDVSPSRLEFARKFAATGTFESTPGIAAEEIAQSIKEMYALGAGADAVMEATGVEPCIEAGVHVLRSGGTFVQAGLGKSKVQFPIVALSEKELHLKGSFRYCAGDYDLAIHLLECGKVKVKELITAVEPFERTIFAWERTKKGEGIKSLIRGPGF
jgi:D-xylulose reductase